MARYSNEDLEHFRKIVQEKIDACERDIKDCEETIKTNTENSNVNSLDEVGQSNLFNIQLMNKNKEKLFKLKAAMFRINNKTYGICQNSGKLIDRRRLELIPETTISI